MPSRRAAKAAEAIREVVSLAILMDLQDPRIQNVTVTYVEVSADMRHAKVHVSVMGDEAQQQKSIKGLQLDHGVKHSMEVTRILEAVLPKSAEEPESDPTESDKTSNDDNPL